MLAFVALFVQTGLLVCCCVLIRELRLARFESKDRGERRLELAEGEQALVSALETELRRVRKVTENGGALAR